MTAAFLYSYVIYYLRKSSELDYKIWDSKTTTSSDFTVMIPIPELVWKAYQSESHYRQKYKEKEPLEHFKEHFRREISAQVQKLPNVLSHDCEDNVKVASLSLAYDNREILEILKSRGQSLINGR